MKKMEWLRFEDAKKYVLSLGLKSKREYYRVSKSFRGHYNIPTNPDKTYKEWKGFGDFLGTNNGVGSKRIHSVNHGFFKKWSSDMAYILGFWITDGHICKNNFAITQHEDNKYILQKISDIMGSSYPIQKSTKNVCRITIRSKEIVEDIKRLGGTERKSKTIRFPSVPKKYLPDFIRGLWDGDGTIFYGNNDKYFESHYVTASKRFAKSFLTILRECIPGIKGEISIRTTKKGTLVYYINFYKNSTIKLGKFMYQKNNETKMHRKYELFMSAISNGE